MNSSIFLKTLLFPAVLSMLISCQKDPLVNQSPTAKTGPTAYKLKIPSYFPPMPEVSGNPLTVEGVELGRRLFYEPMLSGDNTMSCASCHRQSDAFSHAGFKVSKGIDGFDGFRNTMPLFNLAWADGYNWDGRFNALETQTLSPITLPFEMHENLENAISELKAHSQYPTLFTQAFGSEGINSDRVSKALSQFLRTLVAGNPKIVPGLGDMLRTPAENRGFKVFLDENKGDCFHCHEVNVFATSFRFINNGLNSDPSTDPGLYGVTGNPSDIGKFKTPSLINIAYTAPYMHDGRFSTLEEVLDFYDEGFHNYPTLDPNLKKHLDSGGKPIPRTWTAQDKSDLLAFLRALTDTTLMHNPAFSKP